MRSRGVEGARVDDGNLSHLISAGMYHACGDGPDSRGEPRTALERRMEGMRHLLSIADGLLTHFMSRNNDCDGYWALGILVALGSAVPPDDAAGAIDLAAGEGWGILREPRARTIVDRMTVAYNRHLDRARIERGLIASAELRVDILLEQRRSRRADHLLEHRVRCRSVIVSTPARTHERIAETWVSPHDPEVDVRSAREPS